MRAILRGVYFEGDVVYFGWSGKDLDGDEKRFVLQPDSY